MSDDFETRCWSHYDFLCRSLAYLCKDSTLMEPEDLAAASIIKAIKYKDKFHADVNLRGWLFTIGRNTGINMVNAQSRQERLRRQYAQGASSLYLSEFSRNVSGQPDQLLASEIDQALDAIHPKSATCIYLFHVKDLKYKDIAEVLDIPEGTVMSCIYRGRRALWDILGNVARELGLEAPEGEECPD